MTSRRELLLGALALATIAVTGHRPAAAQLHQPLVRPRGDWAHAGPVGPIQAEDDVRFLLVHHTATANRYAPGDVPALLRTFYDAHTAEKGWADIAYNFLVDAHGTIWEGREGSLAGAVRGDATGGSQGFAVLAAFIGNHDEEPPTDAAAAAMVDLLAWQATIHGIDPTAMTTFTSRGSNLHPAGTSVTTRTVTGHNTMSQTVCPGRWGTAFIATLPDQILTRLPSPTPVQSAAASRPEEVSAVRSEPLAAPDDSPPTATPASTPVDEPMDDRDLSGLGPLGEVRPPVRLPSPVPSVSTSGPPERSSLPLGGAATVVAATGAGVLYRQHVRRSTASPQDGDGAPPTAPQDQR